MNGESSPSNRYEEWAESIWIRKQARKAEEAAKKARREEERRRARETFLKRFKPCPFCGHNDPSVELNGSKEYPDTDWVQCQNCKCTGPCGTGQEEVVELWNKRGRKD